VTSADSRITSTNDSLGRRARWFFSCADVIGRKDCRLAECHALDGVPYQPAEPIAIIVVKVILVGISNVDLYKGRFSDMVRVQKNHLALLDVKVLLAESEERTSGKKVTSHVDLGHVSLLMHADMISELIDGLGFIRDLLFRGTPFRSSCDGVSLVLGSLIMELSRAPIAAAPASVAADAGRVPLHLIKPKAFE